ncbi:MAG: hypothetical protein IMW86_02465 [Hydrogenibacillus sp.]|nr:hypothetical protein [Hydrogenibacillus sp.]
MVVTTNGPPRHAPRTITAAEIQAALGAYGLRPRALVIYRRTARVETDGGVYALTAVPDRDAFVRTAEKIASYGLRRPFAVPYVPTRTGRYVADAFGRAFALAPWLAETTGEHAARLGDGRWVSPFLTELARWHAAFRLPVASRLFWPEAEALIARWEKRRTALVRWADDVAALAYPSPVDVLFAHVQPDLLLALDQALAMAREWHTRLTEISTVDMTLIHAYPTPERIALTAHGPLLFDWTRAEEGPVVRDLLAFWRALRIGPLAGAFVEGLQAYRAVRALLPEEEALFSAAVFYPAEPLNFLERYFAGDMRAHMIDLTARFERVLQNFYAAREALIPFDTSVPFEERPDVEQK